MRKILAALAVLAAIPALAQTALPDPTRPPLEALAPQAERSGPAVAAVAAGPQLQSVLLARRPGGRKLAVIDGAIVPLGGKVGGAVLVEVREGAVVLQRGKQKQVLKLVSSGQDKARQP
ncbi:MSHA biogenesis protein MshK [Pseudoduganella sp. S-14]|jgi:MSHA biogenesis protein MshK|uniref:MSHA biogenesis protein MshK n=1 Tax=Pseudoduganella sp. S-14 TaxID=3404065 RepID=UPI003CEEACE8